MEIAEVTVHLATCVIMQGYKENLLHNDDLKELCSEGFDQVK